MQNPNEDTEWNDILRAKGIIPEKEVTEADLTTMVWLFQRCFHPFRLVRFFHVHLFGEVYGGCCCCWFVLSNICIIFVCQFMYRCLFSCSSSANLLQFSFVCFISICSHHHLHLYYLLVLLVFVLLLLLVQGYVFENCAYIFSDDMGKPFCCMSTALSRLMKQPRNR